MIVSWQNDDVCERLIVFFQNIKWPGSQYAEYLSHALEAGPDFTILLQADVGCNLFTMSSHQPTADEKETKKEKTQSDRSI